MRGILAQNRAPCRTDVSSGALTMTKMTTTLTMRMTRDVKKKKRRRRRWRKKKKKKKKKKTLLLLTLFFFFWKEFFKVFQSFFFFLFVCFVSLWPDFKASTFKYDRNPRPSIGMKGVLKGERVDRMQLLLLQLTSFFFLKMSKLGKVSFSDVRTTLMEEK